LVIYFLQHILLVIYFLQHILLVVSLFDNLFVYWTLSIFYYPVSWLPNNFQIFKFHHCCLNTIYRCAFGIYIFGRVFSCSNYVDVCFNIFGQFSFKISVFNWRRNQIASET
jgi:hypothetical protein